MVWPLEQYEASGGLEIDPNICHSSLSPLYSEKAELLKLQRFSSKTERASTHFGLMWSHSSVFLAQRGLRSNGFEWSACLVFDLPVSHSIQISRSRRLKRLVQVILYISLGLSWRTISREERVNEGKMFGFICKKKITVFDNDTFFG